MSAALVAHRAFLDDVLARQAARRAVADPQQMLPPAPAPGTPPPPPPPGPPAKTNVANYVPAEEAVRNDHADWYGVSGECGIEYVLGARDNVCEEFPALRRLMDLKAAHVDAVSHAPLTASLSTLGGHRFDVVLIHAAGLGGDWAATASLPVRQLSADPGFVFLWVGQGDGAGLERGRECLARWGFRRAEDIVHVSGRSAGGGLLAAHKEHCLMGIRGTVRRSTDGRFVHCNVDTDVIVEKDHLYTLIENFCLGARRLELFGGTPRRGWVNVGGHVSSDANADVQPFDAATYPALLPPRDEGKPLVPFNAEIDSLRPKSPQRGNRLRAPPPPPQAQAQSHALLNSQQQPGRPHPAPTHSAPAVLRMGPATPAYDHYGAHQLGPAFAQMGMGEDAYGGGGVHGGGGMDMTAGWAQPWAPHMGQGPSMGLVSPSPAPHFAHSGMPPFAMGMGVGMGMPQMAQMAQMAQMPQMLPQAMMGQPMLGGMLGGLMGVPGVPGLAGVPLPLAHMYPPWNYQQPPYDTYDDFQPGE
ncbi:regulatory protein [Cryptotrichosporon argae]